MSSMNTLLQQNCNLFCNFHSKTLQHAFNFLDYLETLL